MIKTTFNVSLLQYIRACKQLILINFIRSFVYKLLGTLEELTSVFGEAYTADAKEP